MPSIPVSNHRSFVFALGVSLSVNGCHGGPDRHDPCTILAASDAAPYVGPLATPPFRASDRAPDGRGDQCIYLGRDGRELAIDPDWNGAPGAATTDGSIEAWDSVTWNPRGFLRVSKGPLTTTIDVSEAGRQERDATDLARAIISHLRHPLHYDGTRAAALAHAAIPARR